jgi:GTP-binding protein LepA
MDRLNPKLEKIRNFCIIAHIDHGKSTLADRIIELATGEKLQEGKERVLDTLQVEQDRGITIKMQTARLLWDDHILNLIDTPGHVDFSFEVSRSVVSSEGALLLIDAKQGVQAQTLSNYRLAKEHGLDIIPVISKIDLENIDLEKRKKEIEHMLGFKQEDIFMCSGRTGEGVEEVLNAIVMLVSSPKSTLEKHNLESSSSTQALIFDSLYDQHKGVILLVRLIDGNINKGESLFIANSNGSRSFDVQSLGWVTPKFQKRSELKCGEVGYIETGIKNYEFVYVGETLTNNQETKPVFKFKKPKPKMFASIYPTELSDYDNLRDSIQKLLLNDTSVTYTEENSNVLGSGFRMGFLGLLHMEVFQERLEQEFEASLIITSPTVEYKAIMKDDSKMKITKPAEYPDLLNVKKFLEPYVEVHILTPAEYMSPIMDYCQMKRGIYLKGKMDEDLFSLDYVLLKYEMPLAEIITGFFNKLKAISRGYASMDYSFTEYKEIDLVKVSILVNKDEVEALSFLETRENSRDKGVRLLKKLKEEIPKHQFKIPLQAAIGSKVIAREDIGAYRKDVLQRLHASDPSRRRKLLENQKKGKQRMKAVGSVNIPQDAFLSIVKM